MNKKQICANKIKKKNTGTYHVEVSEVINVKFDSILFNLYFLLHLIRV